MLLSIFPKPSLNFPTTLSRNTYGRDTPNTRGTSTVWY